MRPLAPFERGAVFAWTMAQPTQSTQDARATALPIALFSLSRITWSRFVFCMLSVSFFFRTAAATRHCASMREEHGSLRAGRGSSGLNGGAHDIAVGDVVERDPHTGDGHVGQVVGAVVQKVV